MHYAVKSWNELLSANTNKLKLANSLCHRAKPNHLEADSATGSWTPRVTAKSSQATRRRHIVVRDPFPEVQFRDEEAETRIVLHARHARRNEGVMHSHTLTLRLVSLS